MNQQTKSIAILKDGRIALADLLFEHDTLGAEVVVGAIIDPKIPTYVGD